MKCHTYTSELYRSSSPGRVSHPLSKFNGLFQIDIIRRSRMAAAPSAGCARATKASSTRAGDSSSSAGPRRSFAAAARNCTLVQRPTRSDLEFDVWCLRERGRVTSLVASDDRWRFGKPQDALERSIVRIEVSGNEPELRVENESRIAVVCRTQVPFSQRFRIPLQFENG